MAGNGDNRNKELLKVLWDFTARMEDRCRAAEQLGNTGNGDLTVTFVELLKLDHSYSIRKAAIIALGKVGNENCESAISLLEKISTSSPEPEIKSEALSAIIQIKARHVYTPHVTPRQRSRRARSSTNNNARRRINDSQRTDRSDLVDGDLVRELSRGTG